MENFLFGCVQFLMLQFKFKILIFTSNFSLLIYNKTEGNTQIIILKLYIIIDADDDYYIESKVLFLLFEIVQL